MTYPNAEVNSVLRDEGGWRYGEADDGTEVRTWLGDDSGWDPVPVEVTAIDEYLKAAAAVVEATAVAATLWERAFGRPPQ